MTDTPEVELRYQCQKCGYRFSIPLRITFDEDEYNACSRCSDLRIKRIYCVGDEAEFDNELDAFAVCFELEEEKDYEN